MFEFEVIDELMLRATCIDGGGCIYTKAGAQVAVLSDGNPLILDSPCCVDPDALVAWDGADPQFKLDVSFKNLLGKMGASGESYQMEWSQPGTQVIIQPSERKSGIKLAID